MIPFLPRQIRHYVEPFVGSGSVLVFFLAMADTQSLELTPETQFRVNDLNKALMATYWHLKEGPDELLAHLARLDDAYHRACTTVPERKALYMKERDRFCKEKASLGSTRALGGVPPEHCARFVFLSKAGFRGLQRENDHGDYNVPFGNGRRLELDPEHLRAFGSLLRKYNVQLSCEPADRFLARCTADLGLCRGDVVFLDPPYEKVNDVSFTSYGKRPWTFADFRWLVKNARELREVEAIVFVCNNVVLSITEAFKGWAVVVNTVRKDGMQTGRRGRREIIYCSREPLLTAEGPRVEADNNPKTPVDS
jgi:DNA adenine methylase